MHNIVFLIFRRMRRPLITLLLVYAISVLGLVLIPGVDADGNASRMSFFHAFYFVSYMSTTIGFGEIPYEFNDAQRLWVTFAMYAGVISWLYAIGNILTLLQDKTFQHALSENKLARQIKNIREPFYLICGYGQTGSALVKGLTDVGQHAVVIEINEYRRNLLKIETLRDFVPSLHGDARKPLSLQEAGLENRLCQAVVAVTNVNETNLKIAITSKLLHPHIKVICRADSHDVEKNMASLGTEFIIDPYDTFGIYLATAFQLPCLYLLQTWLYSGDREQILSEPVYPPVNAHWVVCGYGRFGKAVYQRLVDEGIKVTVIEKSPELTGEPEGGVVNGRGTEADTLIEANIDSACGLIAGTDDDANNLSIVITARELNADLFVIIRQNHSDNDAIIEAVKADMVMQPSKIIADKIRILLGTPLMYKFVTQAFKKDNDWACELVSRISALVGQHNPELDEIVITQEKAGAVTGVLKKGEVVLSGDLLRDPWDRNNNLSCIILMLERKHEMFVLPSEDLEIKEDDHLLVCSGRRGIMRLYWNLQHENILSYVRTGQITKQSWLWRKLSRNSNV